MLITFFFGILSLLFLAGSIRSSMVLLKLRELGTSDMKHITIDKKKYKKSSLFKWMFFNYIALVAALLLLMIKILKADFGLEISTGLYLTGASIMFFTILRNAKNKRRFEKFL